MRLYFVRHGESEGNLGRRHQTRDTPLSETGRKQAQVLAERARYLPLEIILASPYARAQETAKVIAAATKLRVEIIDVLHEFKRPSEIEGKDIHDPDALRVKKLVREHFGDKDWRYADEENFFDLQKRISQFWTEVSQRSEKHILVVSHGGIIKDIIAIMLFGEALTPDLSRRFFDGIPMANTGLTICDRREDRVWNLVTLNDQSHLG